MAMQTPSSQAEFDLRVKRPVALDIDDQRRAVNLLAVRYRQAVDLSNNWSKGAGKSELSSFEKLQ
jgi:hypothetical protein